MKRMLMAFIGVCLAATAVEAQRGGGAGPRGGTTSDVLGILGLLPQNAPAGRGGPQAIPAQTAWWTDVALMSRLGLTDAQKAKIESTYQAHKPNLALAKAMLESEEAQLSRLLAVDPVNRSAVQSQVSKVIQARAEMERVNAGMTLEMREQLTGAQWAQLQLPPAAPRGGGGRGALAPANPAPDSFAAKYDANKPFSLNGTVIELRFINPHALIVFDATDRDGKISRWTGEMGPATTLSRQGWTETSLKPGDRIHVDGSHSLDPNENLVNVRMVTKNP